MLDLVTTPVVTYTVQDAATRVGRGVRTIERWIASGALEVYAIQDARGRVIRRYVTEGQLLSVYRDMLLKRRR